MKITDLLSENCVFLNVKAQEKEAVWSLLGESLEKCGAVSNLAGYLSDIKAREDKGTTGVGFGVAIPHAKSSAVTRPALAMARLETGVDVASLDGSLADLFFQIAAPVNGEDIHLKALSKLARMLMHTAFRDALRQAQTPAEILDVIRQKEAEV